MIAAEEGNVEKLQKMLTAEQKRIESGETYSPFDTSIDRLPLVARHDSSGATALINAAKNGREECVELLLSHGADSFRRNKWGMTALMFAAYTDSDAHLACLRTLIPKSHVDAKDDSGRSALSMAARRPGSGAFEELFKVARHDFASDEGMTPLMVAVKHGYERAVKLLLPTSNAAARNKEGKSAIDLAIGKDVAILKMLLARNLRIDFLGSAVLAAIENYSFVEENLALLAEHGAMKSKEVVYGVALLSAVRSSEFKGFETLLPYGDCNVRDGQGMTLLMHAAKNTNGLGIVKKLIGLCDPNAFDYEGYTALTHAVEAGNVKCIRVLLSKTDPKYRLPKGKTLLMLAAQVSPEAIQAVLPKSDTSAVDDFGCDALMWAARGHSKCVEALLPICDPQRTDQTGYTALMWAAYSGSESCVRVLLPHSKVKAKNAQGNTAAQVAEYRELSVMINKWKPSRELQLSK